MIETETFREGVNLNLVKAIEGFNRIDDVEVVSGIVEGRSADYPDGTSVATVALAQHEGTENIPSRPWVAIAFDNNLDVMRKQMDNAIDNVLFRRTKIDQALSRVGQRVLVSQRKALADLDTPPLSPRTVRKKAADRASGRKPKSSLGYPVDKPLVETQHLFDQHVFLVRGHRRNS